MATLAHDAHDLIGGQFDHPWFLTGEQENAIAHIIRLQKAFSKTSCGYSHSSSIQLISICWSGNGFSYWFIGIFLLSLLTTAKAASVFSIRQLLQYLWFPPLYLAAKMESDLTRSFNSVLYSAIGHKIFCFAEKQLYQWKLYISPGNVSKCTGGIPARYDKW